MSKDESEFRDLMAGAESARLADIRELNGELPVPTVEQRARLFLRAVHGERDFTSGEYARAHSTILSALAADIAARSKSGTPGEPLGTTVPPIGDPYGESISTEAMCSPADDQSMYVDDFLQISPACDSEHASGRFSGASSSFSWQFSRASRPSAEPEFRIPNSMRSELPAFIDDVSSTLPAPTHKPAKRRVFIWSAAISVFAALGVLGGLALYRTTTQSVSLTAQSTRGDIFGARTPISAQSDDGSNAIQTRIEDDAPAGTPPLLHQRAGGISTPGAAAPVRAEEPVAFPPVARSGAAAVAFALPPVAVAPPVAAAPPAPAALPVAVAPRVAAAPPAAPAQKNIEQSKADSLERARTVIAAGDIETTRAALSNLVKEGNAWAALELGKTYDPNILDALGVRNFSADVAKARVWYQKAQVMGSPEAVGLLESLERSSKRRSR
jgi:hypothetical protein